MKKYDLEECANVAESAFCRKFEFSPHGCINESVKIITVHVLRMPLVSIYSLAHIKLIGYYAGPRKAITPFKDGIRGVRDQM